MHRKTSKAEKRQRVEDLLLAVGLRNIAHTRIQQMSGGERKRLSLAEEVSKGVEPFFSNDGEIRLLLKSLFRHEMIFRREGSMKNAF